MLRRRIHIPPRLQLRKLLPGSIRDQRTVGLHPLLVRYRVPVVRGVGRVRVGSGSGRGGVLRDVDYGGDGGGEDEPFEGWVFSGGLEDGEGAGDCGFD